MDGTVATTAAAAARADDAGLYDRDFVAWTEREAARLREAASRGSNLPVDWLNVAEEIESLGRSDARELESRMATVAEHLLRLAHSPARDPRAGWEETVGRERGRIARLLRQSPSLRPRVADLVADAVRDGAADAVRSLRAYGEIEAAAACAQDAGAALTAERLLGEWLPDAPSGTTTRR